jgi:hypothetical protein
MGLPSRQPVHARHRHGAGGRDDPREAPDQRGQGKRPSFRGGLIRTVLLLLSLLAAPVRAETLRIATWNAELSRAGPGLLLRDLRKPDDPQVEAVVTVLTTLDADVLLLTGIDYDFDAAALSALNQWLLSPYPHMMALRPNTGVATGLDLDGNGQLGEARDAQGYGRFAGQAGMAILSRKPILKAEVRDFSGFLWRDLPGADLPPDMAPEVADLQRLSTSGHWEVPLDLGTGQTLRLLAWYATPPVFDGPEDRNGRRNHDEAAFWLRLLAGDLPFPPPETPFILLGQSNLDPADGEGRREAMQALLTHPALQDPEPRAPPDHMDSGHHGDPTLDTALYETIGGLRVEVILPSANLTVTAAGMLPATPAASRHRPIWVEITLP